MRMKNFSRRSFIKTGAVAVVTTPVSSLFGASVQSITIFHTNDLHEDIRQLPYISGYVKACRKKNSDSVFVDAGDWFDRGSSLPMVTRGEAMYGAMARCGYDAWVMGNHDWAYGGARLRELMRLYPIPVLASNLDTAKPPLPTNMVRTMVREFGGIRIGFFGLTIDRYGTNPKRRPYIYVLDCRASTVRALAELKQKKVDVIVAVTHLGYERMKHESGSKGMTDKELSREFPEIDVIVGGHSHTLLKSDQVHNVYKQSGTIIVQAGASGRYVGRLVLRVDVASCKICGFESELIEVTDALPVDQETAAFVAAQYARHMPDAQRVVARLSKNIERHNVGCWYARFLKKQSGADAVLLPVRAFNKEPKALNKGALDVERLRGYFYDRWLIQMEVKGSDLLAYCRQSSVEDRFNPLYDRGRPFTEDAIYIDGFTARFDTTTAEVIFDIDPERTYKMITPWIHSWRDLSAQHGTELPLWEVAKSAIPINGLKFQSKSVLKRSTVQMLLGVKDVEGLQLKRIYPEPSEEWVDWKAHCEAERATKK